MIQQQSINQRGFLGRTCRKGFLPFHCSISSRNRFWLSDLYSLSHKRAKRGSFEGSNLVFFFVFCVCVCGCGEFGEMTCGPLGFLVVFKSCMMGQWRLGFFWRSLVGWLILAFFEVGWWLFWVISRLKEN